MYTYPSHQPQTHTLYQADPSAAQTLRAMKEKVHDVAAKHANKYVRIQTVDGHVYEGYIAGADRGMLYIRVADHSGMQRAFNPYYNTILPLVLYELLVITLLYT